MTFKLLLSALQDFAPAELGWRDWLRYKVVGNLSEFGLNHAALVVDWNTSTLVVARPLRSKNINTVLPINDERPFGSEALDAVCRVATEWNRRWLYDNALLVNRDNCKGSCHHFFACGGLVVLIGELTLADKARGSAEVRCASMGAGATTTHL